MIKIFQSRIAHHKSLRTKRNGFTIVELLVVISIIALLSAGIFAVTFSQPDKARDTTRLANLAQIKDGLDLYYQDNNFYPTTNNFLSGATWKDSSGKVVYLSSVPKDPSSSNAYSYVTDTNSSTPQWAIVYAPLSKAQTNEACRLPDYVVTGGCVPGINRSNISSYGCVVLGNITCAAPNPTPTTAIGGPTPTFTPTPTPSAAPTPPPAGSNMVQDSDHDGHYTGVAGPQVTTGSSLINNRTYYKTADSNGQYIFISPTGLTGNDCDDTNGNIYQSLATSTVDADHDGYYTGNPLTSCVGPASTAPITGNLVLNMPMDESSGSQTSDLSGFGNNGTFGFNYGLSGYWKMDEGTGNSTADSSGNNLTASFGGGPTWTTGYSAGGIVLNGSGQGLAVSNNTVLNPTRQITITGWFKANNLAKSSGWQSIFFKGNSPDDCSGGCSNRQYAMWLNNNGTLYFTSTSQDNIGIGQTVCQTPVVISAGNWYNFTSVVNADSGVMQVYVNGVLQCSVAYSTSGIRTTAGSLYFGYQPSWDSFLNGVIDDFRVYSRALDTNEIASLYNGQTGPTWTTAHSGASAVLFDGNSSSIAINNSTSVNVGNNQSVAAWVNWNGSGNNWERIVGKGLGVRNYGLWIYPNGAWLYQLSDTNGNWCNAQYGTATTTGWNYLVGTYDGTTAKLYLNRNLVASAACAMGTIQVTDPLYVGYYPTIASFNGAIDDVRLYSRTLSASEVVQLFNNSTAGVSGFWQMNESTGAGVIDSSGNGNNGLANGASIVAGHTGLARSFNGTTDYISAPSSASLPTGSHLTAAAWIYPKGYADPNYNGIISFGPRGCCGTSFTFAVQSSGRLSVATWGPGQDFVPTTGPAVTLNTWNHVAAVLNGSQVTLYINGVQAATGSISAGTPNVQNGVLTIGSTDNPGRYFNGLIDDAVIYNRSLSDSEISQIYSGGVITGGYGGITKNYYEDSSGKFSNFLQQDAIGPSDPNDNNPLVW